MTAFIVSDTSVRDAGAFQAYRTRAAGSITRHGGCCLARGGAVEALEGAWEPRNVTIVEFPSVEQARAW